jgi:PKD repeat protein
MPLRKKSALFTFENYGRFLWRNLPGCLMLGCWLLIGLTGYAQCLPAAGCQPGAAPAANHAFSMGIHRVMLAGLDTATNGVIDGYQDYGCRARAAQLVRGASYPLTVHTNPNTDETVRAWLDYNNDGQFSAAELVLSSNNARQHMATLLVPTTAPAGVALRLRIAADYSLAPVPTACSSPQYSQTEDYRVVLLATAPPRPQIRFTALDTVSCGSPVLFRDRSLHAPNSWRWRFGDGATSTQPNPQHQYAQPGTYAVTLTACNFSGCDSLTRAGYITVRADAPQPAACQPATTAYCCGFGPTRVRLAGIDQHSADGQTGYQDFSCPQRATLTTDRPALLQLTTGAVAHDVRVYLDLNDDGQFTAPAELLYQGLSMQSPSIVLNIPATTPGLVYHRPLRLRLWTDAAGSPFAGPCTSPRQGQVEDYSVVIRPNAAPPAAAFALSYEQLCGPVRVAVTNQTVGGATSYAWEFGDGAPVVTSAAPPPHTYAGPGTYELTLVARSAYGTDTVRRTVVAAPCAAYCPANGRGGTASLPVYFTRAQLAGLDNTDPRQPGTGYRDYTARYAELIPGQFYTLRAESPPFNVPGGGTGPFVRVTAWIDYNQDGVFSRAERLGQLAASSPYLLPFRVPAGARPGGTRLRLQIVNHNPSNPYDPDGSCPSATVLATTEDYSVLIMSAAAVPTAGFAFDGAPACTGTVQFRDTSYAVPTQWHWTFGDGTTSTQQHPRHTYAQPGTFTVSLRVTNRYGSHTVTRPAYVTVTALSQGPVPPVCVPVGGTVATFAREISAVEIGRWSYTNSAPRAGYRDETCALPPVWLAASTLVNVTLREPLGNQNILAPRLCQIWLDANDDGQFAATEQVMRFPLLGYGPEWVSSFVTPTGAVLNRPLRLRVWWTGFSGTSADDERPCTRAEESGQVRDFTVIVTAPTALAPARRQAAWDVFPNPSSGGVTVRGRFAQPTTVEVRDALGRVVYRQPVRPAADQSLPLELSSLPRGVYLLRVGILPQAVRLVLH